MRESRLGIKNGMFGKFHTKETKMLISQSRKGQVHSSETRKAITIANGTSTYLYAACLNNHTDAFCLIQEFSSIREVGRYLRLPIAQFHVI